MSPLARNIIASLPQSPSLRNPLFIGLTVIGASIALDVVLSTLRAQHESHDRWHNHYINWVNKDGKGCCNNHDCRELSEAEERTENGRLEVLVHGVGLASGTEAWCPVLASHYLLRGNAPNWAASHACVTSHYGGRTPCEQLICYQPKPLY